MYSASLVNLYVCKISIMYINVFNLNLLRSTIQINMQLQDFLYSIIEIIESSDGRPVQSPRIPPELHSAILISVKGLRLALIDNHQRGLVVNMYYLWTEEEGPA
jgi:hypothetical protein